MRFPRTKKGWKALFWLFLRCCPICHTALCQDWSLFDDKKSLWCLNCGGTRFPKGIIRALVENENSYKEKP